jgi:sugar/nucleoside kinase (ribokinase family)
LGVEHVSYGIIIDDIMFPLGRTQMGVLGGGGPQTAWGTAAALGSGEKAGLVAGIGNELEAEALAPLEAAGVNLDGIRLTGLPTPRAWQIVKSDGDRRHTWRVPVQTLATQLERGWDVLPPSYREARTFHWGIHPGDSEMDRQWARKLHDMGRIVSLETYIPPSDPLAESEFRSLMDVCTVFSPNWYEAVGITRIADYKLLIRRFQTLGCHILALRRGEQGSDVWDFSREVGVHVPAVRARIVDVVGAGNAFCGALLARLHQGIEEAACFASAAASYLIEQVGMPASLPDPVDFERRLEEVRAGRKLMTIDELQ